MTEHRRFSERRGRSDSPPCPPLSGLEMPEQSLSVAPPGPLPLLARDRRVKGARWMLLVGTLSVTGFLANEMGQVLAVGQLTVIEAVMLVLFVVNIAWIAFGSVSTVLGLLLPRPAAVPRAENLTQRTALLMPTYNEDPARVVGAALAMLRALAKSGHGKAFDFFVLSDTNRPDVWLGEQALIDRARDDPEIGGRLYYRHRLRNRARNSGS